MIRNCKYVGHVATDGKGIQITQCHEAEVYHDNRVDGQVTMMSTIASAMRLALQATLAPAPEIVPA